MAIATIIKLDETSILLETTSDLNKLSDEYYNKTNICVETIGLDVLLNNVYELEINPYDFGLKETDIMGSVIKFLSDIGLEFIIDKKENYFKNKKLRFVFFNGDESVNSIDDLDILIKELKDDPDYIDDLSFNPTYSKTPSIITDRSIPQSLPGFKEFVSNMNVDNYGESSWGVETIEDLDVLMSKIKIDNDLFAVFT